ncbi:glycine-rich protein [Hymenobacter edaphi]|uniref:receptor protein-tyrosine kinase n=1 Tax=Hymenobacter edaphi TaxID=2211146 RepID=A0A328B7P4_9BACT|nr:glycine-rich protein [Hymenobacter edaphi]RAK62665.1 hypothetical protein DLM85_22620 [Hymenobacter edaphi]
MMQRYVVRAGAALIGGWLLAAPAAQAQTGGVGIGTSTVEPSAALEVKSASKGLLPPRMDEAARNLIGNPAPGLTIFNTTSGVLNVWNGTSWQAYLAESIPAGLYPPNTYAPVAFAYTGAPQTYTVPAGVTQLRVDMAGAGGIVNGPFYRGGNGGRLQAQLTVTPGEVLTIYVGGMATGYDSGSAGYNGAANGGGGATDIRRGGGALAGRVLVAGGGGGGGQNSAGGCGGGTQACSGASSGSGIGGSAGGGAGGGQTGPAAGGSSSINQPGQPGGLGVGGAGNTGGGGGGGGYYGGGGGGYDGIAGAGGGGGSSFALAGSTTAVVHSPGTQVGNGYVRLGPLLPAPVLDGSNIVNLRGLGDHTATQNLDLATYQLVGNGGSQGLRISSTGNVGIGSSAPTARLEVDGFTRLGANAPAIKTLELAGTLPGGQGQAFVAHGLDENKILSVTAIATAGANYIPPGYTLNSGVLYGVYINNDNVVLQTGNSISSGTAYGKPVRILIIYRD